MCMYVFMYQAEIIAETNMSDCFGYISEYAGKQANSVVKFQRFEL